MMGRSATLLLLAAVTFVPSVGALTVPSPVNGLGVPVDGLNAADLPGPEYRDQDGVYPNGPMGNAYESRTGNEPPTPFDSPPAPPEGGWLSHGAAPVAIGLALVAAATLAAWKTSLLARLQFLALPLFSRLQRPKLLDHATRSRLFDAIECEPGINLTTLGQRFGLGKGVLYHHLRMMERHGLIRSRRLAWSRVYHKAGVRVEEARPLTPAQERFLEALGQLGPSTRETLAARLGLTLQAVSHHAGGLARHGIVRHGRSGRHHLWSLVPAQERGLPGPGSTQ